MSVEKPCMYNNKLYKLVVCFEVLWLHILKFKFLSALLSKLSIATDCHYQAGSRAQGISEKAPCILCPTIDLSYHIANLKWEGTQKGLYWVCTVWSVVTHKSK